jgi:hypothetical protein
VITRYNWSSYYAMAVIDLGREVKAALPTMAAAAPADAPPAAASDAPPPAAAPSESPAAPPASD